MSSSSSTTTTPVKRNDQNNSDATTTSATIPDTTANDKHNNNNNMSSSSSPSSSSLVTVPSTFMNDLGFPSPLILGSSSFSRRTILQEMGIPYHVLSRPIDESKVGGNRRNNNDQTTNATELVLQLGHAKMNHLIREITNGNCPSKDWPANLQPSSSSSTSSSNSNSKSKDDNDNNNNDNNNNNNVTIAPSSFVVLTGDQVVTCQGRIFEKPKNIQEAFHFVNQYGNHPPSTVGSIVMTHWPTLLTVSATDTATIYFDPILSSPSPSSSTTKTSTTSPTNTTTTSTTTTKSSTTTVAQELVQQLFNAGAPILSCAGGLMIEHPLVQPYIKSIHGTEDSVRGLNKSLVKQLLQQLSIQVTKRNGSN